MEASLGNLPEAETLFQQALEAQPDHIPSLQAYALLLMKKRHFAKAEKLLGQALEKDPNHLPTLYVLGSLSPF